MVTLRVEGWAWSARPPSTLPASPNLLLTFGLGDALLNGGWEGYVVDLALELFPLEPVLVCDGEDTDHTEGAVELLLTRLRLGCVHLLVIHKPADLDLRVFQVHHHTCDLRGSGNGEGVLGFRGEDEDRRPSEHVRA